MKNLTLKTVAASTSDILIDINLSLFPDNVVSSVSELLRTLQTDLNITSSAPNSDDIILFFYDEMSLKNVYRSIVERIIVAQNPEILEYIQGMLSSFKIIKRHESEKLDNYVLTSLNIQCSGETCCRLQLPPDKYFIKSTLSDVVSRYLQSCGSLEISFPDFNDDEITIIFHSLSDAISFEMFVAADLL